MLDGSKELPVSTNANTIGASCFWSPDGKIIIVGAFDGIYQVDISDMSNIMVKKLVDKGQPIKWFIDGKSIIVVRNDYQQNDQNNQYIESIEITK
jgi:hypothetical protein